MTMPDTFEDRLKTESPHSLAQLEENYENYKIIADDAVVQADRKAVEAREHASVVAGKLALIEAELGRREKKI